MYKALNETAGSEENKTQVNMIENRLANLMEVLKSNISSDAKKIKNWNHMLEIVKQILYFNQLNQSGQGIKILTLNWMLSRLPISLAQLKAGNNSEKLKNETRQLLYSLYRSKKTCKKYLWNFGWHYLNMKTIFKNTENSKTNESNKFIYQFTDRRNLKSPNNKNIGLNHLSIYYTWKNILPTYNNNKFKISVPTWNNEFKLLDASHSISDIQDYFEFIIKKHETLPENLPAQIYSNKIKNRIVFQIKTGYKLELLSPETMKLSGSAKKDVDKDKYGEDVPTLESVEVLLVHCNLVNNSYQKASKALFTFVANKQFGQLITISPHLLTMLKLLVQNFSLLNYGLPIRIIHHFK